MSAICFVYNLKRRDHISPYLKQAHILPIKFRIMFKTCVLCFKIINSSAPAYLRNWIVLKQPSQVNLRSNRDDLIAEVNNHRECTLQNTMCANWNILPYDIRSSPSLNGFKKLLKTHYFNIAFT